MNTKRFPLLVGIVLLVALAFVGVASACGCTPGYWKQEQHFYAWPAPYSRNEVTSFGDLNGDGAADTPLDALKYKGGNNIDGARRILTRAYVAEILNEAAFGDDYPANPDDYAYIFWDTFRNGDRKTMLDLATQLDMWNNAGCPL